MPEHLVNRRAALLIFSVDVLNPRTARRNRNHQASLRFNLVDQILMCVAWRRCVNNKFQIVDLD